MQSQRKKCPLTNIRPRVQALYTRLSYFKDKPCFVTWYPDYGTNNENIKIVPLIEETTRIIRPPSAEHIRLTTLPMKKS
jgi:hypothetical protein